MSFFCRGFFLFAVLFITVSGAAQAAVNSNSKSNAAMLEDEELTQALAGLEQEEVKPAEAIVKPPVKSVSAAVKKIETIRPFKQSADLAPEPAVQKDEFGVPLKKAKAVKKESKLKGGFFFASRLEEAEVQLLNLDREPEVTGDWSGSAFTFSSVKGTEVKTVALPFGALTQQAIATPVLARHVYQIRFRSVAPFEKLTLQYSIKETYQGKLPAYISFRVLAGNHELKRIQVSSKDPWVKQSFNLGVVSFLNSPIPVTFEFSTPQAKGLTFFLIAEAK